MTVLINLDRLTRLDSKEELAKNVDFVEMLQEIHGCGLEKWAAKRRPPIYADLAKDPAMTGVLKLDERNPDREQPDLRVGNLRGFIKNQRLQRVLKKLEQSITKVFRQSKGRDLMLGEYQQVEDLAHDAFLRLMANQELRKLPVTSKRWSVLIHTIGKRTAIDALRGMTVSHVDQRTGKIVRRRRTARIADLVPNDHDQNDHDQIERELADQLQEDEAIQRHKEQTARKDAQDFARAEVERLLSHLPLEDEAFIRDYLTSDKPKSAKERKRYERVRAKLAAIG